MLYIKNNQQSKETHEMKRANQPTRMRITIIKKPQSGCLQLWKTEHFFEFWKIQGLGKFL